MIPDCKNKKIRKTLKNNLSKDHKSVEEKTADAINVYNNSKNEKSIKYSYVCNKRHNISSKSYLTKIKLQRLSQFNKLRKLNWKNNSLPTNKINNNNNTENENKSDRISTRITTEPSTSVKSITFNRCELATYKSLSHLFGFYKNKNINNNLTSSNKLVTPKIQTNYDHQSTKSIIVNSNKCIINHRIPLISALKVIPSLKENKNLFIKKTKEKLQHKMILANGQYNIIIANILIILIFFTINYFFF